MRVGAFDCGTNSLRLLIADVDAGSAATGPTLRDVARQMQVVRLGAGVDATGRLDPHAIERTVVVAAQYVELCRAMQVQALRFIATSATRDATNAADFAAGIRAAVGVEPEVVSGRVEAELSFVGATRGLPVRATIGAGAAADLTAVVDLGGGSTEIVLGTADGAVVAAHSMDVGCVRMTERHTVATGLDIAAIEADVNASLERAARLVPLRSATRLVGVAGSITTVTAHALGLSTYDSARIHAAVVPTATHTQACTDLVVMAADQRAALGFMHPGRRDVIAAGAVIWRTVIDRFVREAGIGEVTTSEHDILDGIAWSLTSYI